MGLFRSMRGVNPFAIFADALGAFVLAIYAIILGPLGVLRGPIVFERTWWYLWVLLPQGLLTRSIRAAIDWRLGNFDSAISQLEGLVGSNEEYFKKKDTSKTRRRVLEDLYTVLARAYLHAGHIDDAMLVVIRAKKSMGLDRLGGLAELDAKTAHLVRAGLAAGRLLDGGGLATMFVKSDQSESSKAPRTKRRSSRRRQGATDGREKRGSSESKDSPSDSSTRKAPSRGSDDGAKIIPFPTDDNQLP